MNNFWIVIGLTSALVALYQLLKGYKNSKEISKTGILVGVITGVLLLEAIDKLTANWLFRQLGNIYYNWLVGALFDAIFIIAALKKTKKKLTAKEKLLNNLGFVYCLVIISWYFMYYLCK